MKRHGYKSHRGAAKLCLALILAQCAAASHKAHAQIVDQFVPTAIPGQDTGLGVTVSSRQHPEYNNVPVRLGNTVVTPTFSQGFGYDSNVTGQTNGKGSAVSETQGSIAAVNQDSDTLISGSISFDTNQYLDLPKQSQTNWDANIGAQRSLGEDLIGFSYAHLDEQENARSLDLPLLDSPVSQRIDDLKMFYNAAINRISLQPALEATYMSFDNGTVNGQVFNQAILDNYMVSPSLTTRYNLAPLKDLIFVVRDSIIQYPRAGQGGRDANSIAFMGGLDFTQDGVWRYKALAGLESRTFRNSGLYNDITTPILSIAVIYMPTELTTLGVSASRHLAVATQLTDASYINNDFRFTVDHELYRNLILSAYAGGQLAEYQNGGGSQLLYEGGASAAWKLNRYLTLQASYDYTGRNNSTGAQNNTVLIGNTALGSNYTENLFMVTAKVAF